MKIVAKKIMSLVLALVAVAAMAQTSFAQANRPFAVVSLSSLDEIFGDLRLVTELAGQADVGNMAIGFAGLYTANFDKTKPAGAYVFMEKDIPRVVAFLPIKNLKGTLAMFRDQIGEPKDVGDGILQVAADKPTPFYIKEQAGYAFVAQSSSHLGALPANPVALLGGMEKSYDIGVRVSIASLPPALKQMAISEIKKGFEKSLEKVEADDRDATEKLGRSMLQSFIRLIEETDDLVYGISIDAKTRRVFLESTVTALPGTSLAKDLAAQKSNASNFAGFLLPGAAGILNVSSRLSPDDMQQWLGMIASMKGKAGKKIDDDPSLPSPEARQKAKSAAATLVSVLEQTIQSGKVDLGASLKLEGDELTFAGGAYVADGAKVEEALKKLVEVAQEKKKITKVELGFATHQGITFHRLTRPLDDDDEDAKEIFGDELDIVVGIGKEAVYVSFGSEPEELLKSIITKSAQDRNVLQPPGQLSLSLGPILKFAATVEDDPKLKALVEIVDQVTGKDHVMLTARLIERGAAYRLEVEEGVIKIIGAASKPR